MPYLLHGPHPPLFLPNIQKNKNENENENDGVHPSIYILHTRAQHKDLSNKHLHRKSTHIRTYNQYIYVNIDIVINTHVIRLSDLYIIVTINIS